jgi:uncharacterized membrane protein YkoI
VTLAAAAPRRAVGIATLTAGLLTVVLPLAACGGADPAASPEPTSVSIAPSSETPATTAAPSPSASASSASGPATPKATDPSIAQSETIRDAAGAVGVAESAVADSTTVEVSRDDDASAVEWEVTVRTGDEGRELRIAQDGSVLTNEADSLSSAQRGELPKITVLDAVETAENRFPGGVVDDAELTTENGQRVWSVSVDVRSGNDWELWIDPSSGEVVHEERD